MPVPTLYSLCFKVAKRIVNDLEDIGDLTYEQIGPILKHITSPAQLALLESNCPQLRGEDAELWQSFIARDLPNWHAKNYKPNNPKSWSKVYDRYMREKAEEVARDSAALKQKMMGIQKHRDERMVKKVENVRALPRLPRDPKMVGRDGKLMTGVRSRETGRIQHAASDMRFTEGSKTKMTSGAGVLLRAKREAKEIGRMNKLLTLTGKLGDQRSKVVAPQAMVDAHRRAALPIATRKDGSSSFTAPAGHGPVAQTSLGSFHTPGGLSLEERERRLREKKLMAAKREDRSTTIVMDSDDDEQYDSRVGSSTTKARINPPRLFSKGPSKPQVVRSESSSMKRKREEEEMEDMVDDDDLFGDTPDVKLPLSPPKSITKRPMVGASQTRPLMKKKTVDVFNRGGSASERHR